MKGHDYADCIFCSGVARKTGEIYICLDCQKEFTDDDIILKENEKTADIDRPAVAVRV